MSKKEREQKIKDFWAHYAPLRSSGGMSLAMAQWLWEDDCLSEEEYHRIAGTSQPAQAFTR